MSIGVHEAAIRLDISEQRVRQLLAAGELSGQQVSGRWVLDEAAVLPPKMKSRPLSERMAWALIEQLSGHPLSLRDMERSRVRDYQRRLDQAAESEVPLLLRSWLRRRAERIAVACAPADLGDLKIDARFVASGYSAPHAGLANGSDAEGYVLVEEAARLMQDFLLVKSRQPNVWLHVVRESHDWPAVLPVLVAADLAEHGGPRECARSGRIIKELAQ